MTIADDGRRSLWADGIAEALRKVRRRQRDLELGRHALVRSLTADSVVSRRALGP